MATKRKTAQRAVHKTTTPKSKNTESVMFWKMILVGAIAALVVSAGFNYVQPRISNAGAATASSTLYYWVNGDTGNDNNAGTKSQPWKTITHATEYIRELTMSGAKYDYTNVKLYITSSQTPYTCEVPEGRFRGEVWLEKHNLELVGVLTGKQRPVLNECRLLAYGSNFKISNLEFHGGYVRIYYPGVTDSTQYVPTDKGSLVSDMKFVSGADNGEAFVLVDHRDNVTIQNSLFYAVDGRLPDNINRQYSIPDSDRGRALIWSTESSNLKITNNRAYNLGNLAPGGYRDAFVMCSGTVNLSGSRNVVTGLYEKYLWPTTCKGDSVDR